jgi:hypothetical protein
MISVGTQDFATRLPLTPLSSTQSLDPGPGQACPGATRNG